MLSLKPKQCSLQGREMANSMRFTKKQFKMDLFKLKEQ